MIEGCVANNNSCVRCLKFWQIYFFYFWAPLCGILRNFNKLYMQD